MVKKIPLRKCVATLLQYPKSSLIRIVKNNEGVVFIDLSGRQNGRGAYLHASNEALAICIKKNALGRSLETTIPPSIYEELARIINGK